MALNSLNYYYYYYYFRLMALNYHYFRLMALNYHYFRLMALNYHYFRLMALNYRYFSNNGSEFPLFQYCSLRLHTLQVVPYLVQENCVPN